MLFKTKDTEIHGIWFFEEAKCRAIGATLDKYVELAEKQKQQGGPAGGGGGNKMDLGSLLSKASNKAAAEKELDNHRNQ